MLDNAELIFGRYNGGQNAPIGTYWNPRTMAYFQQGSDGVLPQAGTWCPVSTDNTKTAAQIATIINTALGTAYTSGSFHSETSSDLISNPGTASDDA